MYSETLFCFNWKWKNPHWELDSKKRPEGGLLCHMVGKCRFFSPQEKVDIMRI